MPQQEDFVVFEWIPLHESDR